MALFKQFHGTETELNTQVPIQEGRNYFLTNNGKMFIDTAKERICLNAEEADLAIALKKGDEELTAESIVTKNDTIGVANGGTGATTLSDARTGLQIDRATASIITLDANVWTVVDNKYQQIVNMPSLTCGFGGNVPPIISPAAGANSNDFALLDSIDADVINKTLTVVARNIPSTNLSIVVTDHQ